jgi:hypothetical protein
MMHNCGQFIWFLSPQINKYELDKYAKKKSQPSVLHFKTKCFLFALHCTSELKCVKTYGLVCIASLKHPFYYWHTSRHQC